jgi:sterol desaturase/sphingolipid hydroxylase (fatty acid hydroxylase superfamily)
MNETQWRLACFSGVLVGLTLLEWLAPRKQRVVPRVGRWLSHFGLVTINTVAARLLIPLSAVEAADWAATHRWGLLNHVQWPVWTEFAVALVLLDLAIYGQHVLFHHVPWFWRLHQVHHADLDLDVTSGIRFHTLEILLSALFKLGLVVGLGPTGVAVMVFEIVLNAGSLWSHSNVRVPLGLDRWLRCVLVTPDMHRVHHSVLVDETNSNYGFHLPWWDYLFGTYTAQPQAGHEEMVIGLKTLREERQVTRLIGLLAIPFQREADATDQSTP